MFLVNGMRVVSVRGESMWVLSVIGVVVESRGE